MKRLAALVCAILCFASLLTLCGCNSKEQKAADALTEKIKQSGVDIFDAAQYPSFSEKAEALFCDECPLNDAATELFDLLGRAAVYRWTGKDDARMPNFGPDDKLPSIFSSKPGADKIESVVFCDGVPNIGDCLLLQRPDLKRVFLPNSVKEIGEHTFPQNGQITIYCHAGSFAAKFAEENGIACQLI